MKRPAGFTPFRCARRNWRASTWSRAR
ncbi:hypothetical protein E3U25_09605 (plasmid) [Paracoccus versutus]|nr:hypothetical protein E3U25_09605 [Paracoccus versutus]